MALCYPIHRKEVLAEIRARLTDGLPCRVVSTSLIEAGVDVDFPAVYRELADITIRNDKGYHMAVYTLSRVVQERF